MKCKTIRQLITIVLTGFTSSVFSQAGQFLEISGIVLNGCNDAPVFDARITFDGIQPNTSTDERGHFTIILKDATSAKMRVVKSGFETYTRNVTSSTQRVEIKIQPEKGCDTTVAKIEITEFKENDFVSGRVSGLDSTHYRQHKVIVFVYTDKWYIHPYVASFAEINGDGSWRINSIHREPSPTQIAACLVRQDFEIPKEVDRLGAIRSTAQTTRVYR